MLLSKFLFAQVPSTEPSFLDKINLVVEPEYQIVQAHWNHKILNNKLYIQKPVDGKLNFKLGHLIGLGIGLQGANWKILFAYKINYQKNNPTALFKLKNGSTIGKEVQSNFVNEDLYAQYFFNEYFGLGLNYKINAEEYLPLHVENYPSLLNVNLGYKMLYLYVPYKFVRRKILFTGDIGFSIYSKAGSMEYFAAFLNYQDPDNPGIPSTAGHATIVIKKRPYSVYWNFGIVLFSKIKLLYQFKYDWCNSYYSEYENSLIIKFAFPSF